MKGAVMEPSLAMEQAKDSATDRTTVGNSSVVYRYTMPQHTCTEFLYEQRTELFTNFFVLLCPDYQNETASFNSKKAIE